MDRQQLLEAIVESASQAIIAVEVDGTIMFVNRAANEMFGYSEVELVGANLEILLPVGAREAHRAHLTTFWKEPTVRPMGIGLDLRGQRKDGTQFDVEISLSHTTKRDGATVGIALISDVTTRKQFEAQVARSQRMDVVGRLAGGVAHDFNNMLTIILGYDRMLLQRMSPLDAMRGYAEEIGRAAERASALTKHLLSFSKHSRFQRQVENLNTLVDEAANLLRAITGEHIQIVTAKTADLGWVSIDREQMHQILANLVINARDALPAGGIIRIETSNTELGGDYARTHLGVQPGPYVMLTVADNGIGMSAETREHIFEPFFTTKGPDKGTGLGLTTVWATVKNFGGDVWVYSELGKGTTFKIYLPRVNAEGTRLLQSPATVATGGSETILVVEDEQGVRDLTAEMLSSLGFRVIKAADALQAIQLAQTVEVPIDLLLTDVVMPKMNGFELTAYFQRVQPGIRVLYMSGYAESSNPLLTEGAPIAGMFVEKPFTFEALVEKIRAVLNS